MNSEVEASRVVENVHLDEVAELTGGMANIPSFSGEEGPVVEYVADRMRELGFDEVVLQEAEFGRPI